MYEEEREELYYRYETEQRRLEEELEAQMRLERETEEERRESSQFLCAEREALEAEGRELGYHKDFQRMYSWLEECMADREAELKRREEELQTDRMELKRRQRESEDRYREAIQRLEAERGMEWES